MLRALGQYRVFVASLVRREFQVRSVRAVWGTLWLVLQPAAQIFIYTVVFAQDADERNIESFQWGLTAIAEGYGITDWEQTEDTFVAIGRGLGESELDASSAKQLAVALSNEDYDHLTLIRSGYEDRRIQ